MDEDIELSIADVEQRKLFGGFVKGLKEMGLDVPVFVKGETKEEELTREELEYAVETKIETHREKALFTKAFGASAIGPMVDFIQDPRLTPWRVYTSQVSFSATRDTMEILITTINEAKFYGKGHLSISIYYSGGFPYLTQTFTEEDRNIIAFRTKITSRGKADVVFVIRFFTNEELTNWQPKAYVTVFS